VPQTLHDRVGGDEFFVALVEQFYAFVERDSVLRPLYPDDLAEPRAWLTAFLIQYWGGSTRYSEERGHPRLRMRHAPFSIGPAERDAWWRGMEAAVRSSGAGPQEQAELLEYFDQAATFMINTR
jgi:hemoglobin